VAAERPAIEPVISRSPVQSNTCCATTPHRGKRALPEFQIPLLEVGVDRLVAGFCGLAEIMQQVRSNYAYWKQREGVESPISPGQQSPPISS